MYIPWKSCTISMLLKILLILWCTKVILQILPSCKFHGLLVNNKLGTQHFLLRIYYLPYTKPSGTIRLDHESHTTLSLSYQYFIMHINVKKVKVIKITEFLNFSTKRQGSWLFSLKNSCSRKQWFIKHINKNSSSVYSVLLLTTHFSMLFSRFKISI